MVTTTILPMQAYSVSTTMGTITVTMVSVYVLQYGITLSDIFVQDLKWKILFMIE